MVKIQLKTIRKRYGRGKSEYHYTQYLLPFSVKHNKTIKPFLNITLKNKTERLEIKCMKTNKISDQTHTKLTVLLGKLMAETGKPKTYQGTMRKGTGNQQCRP